MVATGSNCKKIILPPDTKIRRATICISFFKQREQVRKQNFLTGILWKIRLSSQQHLLSYLDYLGN